MAHTTVSRITRGLLATAIGVIAVSGSLVLASPAKEWLSPGPAASHTIVRDGVGKYVAPLSQPAPRFSEQLASRTDGLTPISAEVRGDARGEQATPMRGTGSIRADIARYNEERNVPRPQGRQSDEVRPPSNAAYRN